MYKKMFVTVAVVLFAFSAYAADLTIEDIINNIQANQSKIKDMYAKTTTTITSNMTLPGQENKGSQKIVQKAKMWTKGSDKSKIEMLSPTRQITITNGDSMAIVNPDTGQKVIQDLKKLQGRIPGGKGEMNLEKAKELFDLSVTKKDGNYVIVGIPKKENKFLGKMEFYIDGKKWAPVKILMYDAKGRLMSQSEIEYAEVSGIFVPKKNKSFVSTPMGGMDIEMVYENVEINKGMSDGEFKL